MAKEAEPALRPGNLAQMGSRHMVGVTQNLRALEIEVQRKIAVIGIRLVTGSRPEERVSQEGDQHRHGKRGERQSNVPIVNDERSIEANEIGL
jgi:hypothetical protein